MERQPNTQYILSLSYGKDSLACLEAIRLLGLPLDRIVHAEVWATDTIPADLPPMVDFKAKADKIILDRYGIKVEHIYATREVERERERERERVTYERVFYRRLYSKKHGREQIYGFPCTKGAWCNSRLKMAAIRQIDKGYIREEVLQNTEQEARLNENGNLWVPDIENQGQLVHGAQDKGFSQSAALGAKINTVQYLGIAADEPERIERHTKPNVILPLVLMGWDEAYCRQWCEENDLLSPIYSTATRGGCWFCHNQGVEQLRQLRHDYPDLWALLLKWDKDSPITFKPNGLTVHDFDKRFFYEDEGKVPADRRFKWRMVDELEAQSVALTYDNIMCDQ